MASTLADAIMPSSCWEPARFTQPVSLHLKCPICLNVCRNAVQCVACDQVFGDVCWHRALLARPACPTCRHRDQPMALPSRLCRQLISDCKLHCGHDGCDVVAKISDMRRHEASCGYRIVTCAHCGDAVVAKELEAHYEECLEFVATCAIPGCNKAMPRRELMLHIEACRLQQQNGNTKSCPFCADNGMTGDDNCLTSDEPANWCRQQLIQQCTTLKEHKSHLKTVCHQQSDLINRSTAASRGLTSALTQAAQTLDSQTAQLKHLRQCVQSVERTRDQALSLLTDSETVRRSMSEVLIQKKLALAQVQREALLLRKQVDMQTRLLNVVAPDLLTKTAPSSVDGPDAPALDVQPDEESSASLPSDRAVPTTASSIELAAVASQRDGLFLPSTPTIGSPALSARQIGGGHAEPILRTGRQPTVSRPADFTNDHTAVSPTSSAAAAMPMAAQLDHSIDPNVGHRGATSIVSREARTTSSRAQPSSPNASTAATGARSSTQPMSERDFQRALLDLSTTRPASADSRQTDSPLERQPDSSSANNRHEQSFRLPFHAPPWPSEGSLDPDPDFP
eukprot:TRINITY_DN9585_c0_g1_i1.p1 TRINITY_DN9585_c0_g1~~TRINITY_DN9585_c0_g1_i1.p1  ORF type:complete len:567 (+),score=87.91 TRINITY_DN9585_c0_g1_i1:66-1766(+)